MVFGDWGGNRFGRAKETRAGCEGGRGFTRKRGRGLRDRKDKKNPMGEAGWAKGLWEVLVPREQVDVDVNVSGGP